MRLWKSRRHGLERDEAARSCSIVAGQAATLSLVSPQQQRAFSVVPILDSNAVPFLFGLVLLGAGILKGYELATEPVAENSLLTSRWLLIGVVEFEVALALWLLGGFYTKQARIVALTTFGVFLGVALSQALSGAASCCCFGKVPVPPWYVAAIDLAALVAFWRWRPIPARSPTIYGPIPISLALLTLLGSVLGAVAMSSYDSPLVLSSKEIDLGSVPRGGHTEGTFWVTNRSDKPVEVVAIQTTCPCLKVEMSQPLIAPGQEIRGRAVLDLAAKPDFVGDLAIEAKGLTGRGRVVFLATVKVTVSRQHEGIP